MDCATPLGSSQSRASEPAHSSASDGGGAGGEQLRLEAAQMLLSSAAAFGLEDCWQWKPLFDGKQVSRLQINSTASLSVC